MSPPFNARRNMKILQMIKQQYSYSEIAKKLDITRNTVAGVINRSKKYYFNPQSEYYANKT